jgi:hypothetical protein
MVRHVNGLLQAFKLRQLVLFTEYEFAKVGLYPPSNLVIKVNKLSLFDKQIKYILVD